MEIRWQNYRNLEMIPNTVRHPGISTSAFATWVQQRLQGFNKSFANHLAPQQQVEHLERCWSKSELEISETNYINIFGVIWSVLKQSVLHRISSQQQEPTIQRLQGTQGSFWYAYDPVTGQTTYLESERELDRWLEEWFCRNL